MRKLLIRVDVACEILELLGCSEDWVERGGVETTPDDLRYSGLANADAKRIVITFSGMTRQTVRGTVFDMVLDRLGAARA